VVAAWTWRVRQGASSLPGAMKGKLSSALTRSLILSRMSSILVWGGNGQLGAVVVDSFKAQGWNVTSVDLLLNPNANQSVQLSGSNLEEDTKKVAAAVADKKFDVVASVAGGWAGGNVASDGIFESVDRMWKMNVQSSIAASHIAAKHLKEGGLLVLTGSSAAMGPTPGMIGYGIAKASVHQLTASLAAPNNSLPSGVTVLALLPITLDTPTNRRFSPNADFSSWTPMPEVAHKILSWSKGERPASGMLVEVRTNKGVTDYAHFTYEGGRAQQQATTKQ